MNQVIEQIGCNRARRATLLAAACTVFSVFTVQAAQAHSAGNLVIVPPSALPAGSREYSEAMMLHETASGRTYLYIEQEQGSKLTVLDVTNPARIKAEKPVALNVSGPFDFVGSAGSQTELIRFRGTGQQAVLDLHKAKAPLVDSLPELTVTGHAIPLGEDGLMVSNHDSEVMTPAQYQIVDAAKSLSDKRVTDVKGVKQEITNSETGTTFLLAEDGLFVVRRPAVEASLESEPINTGN